MSVRDYLGTRRSLSVRKTVAMSDKLQVYYYCLSAPSRAVRVFVETNNIPHDLHTVSVVAGETHSPEYLKINPVGTVPFIQDADFGLVDSGAIMAYLSDRFDVPNHWYPKDIKARAKVNAVLLWHGSTLRLGSGNLMNYRVLYPLLGGKPRQEDIVTGFLLPALQTALKDINDVYLKDTDFVAGSEISIADLLLSFEIEQNRFQDASGQSPNFAQLLEPYPKEDPKARAKVNAALFWFGYKLRAPAMQLFTRRIMLPVFVGKDGESADIVDGVAVPGLKAAFKTMETAFLAGQDFVAGSDISIADLLFACEIDELRLQDAHGKSPSFEELLAEYPGVRAWLQRVSDRCGPYYARANAAVVVAAQEFAKKFKDAEYQIDFAAIGAVGETPV
ncbi:hypothetical protein QBZ16_004897 [Prototheca wickerhamii]|uniref:Glutathione transferase n=1 Tax=Prototheca wickerhamii TaxID=3111 RepID=A0AAD9IGN2_PROWI|nr:hypothetical protein QBZ16_004897 [Prototheca wickerhamii]